MKYCHLVLAVLVLFWAATLAIQDYCKPGFKFDGKAEYQLDLSKLNRVYNLTQKQETPPTTTLTQILLNVCDELPPRPDNVAEEDYCAKGTYVCRRVINEKHGDERVLEVQTIAGDFRDQKLNPAFSVAGSEQDLTKSGAQYSLVLNGGKVKNQAQSVQITLECDTSQSRKEDPKEPTLISYQNNVMSLSWKTVYACATKAGEKQPSPPPENGGDRGDNQDQGGGMSGAGIFFTIIGVLAAVYFIGGVFYNYKMYNARGLDLLPHRDFWLDLPYLIKDLVSHVIDSIMSHRRGGGGYVAV